MRFAVVALSTVLLAGCSWSGSGGGYGDSYSYGQAGGGCAPMAGNAYYGNSSYGFSGGNAGCAHGAGYGVAHGGGMYGAGGGLRGAYGVNGYGTGLQGAGAYGAGGGAGMYGAGGGAGMYGANSGAGMYGTGGGAGMYGAGAGAYGSGAGMYGTGGTAGMGSGGYGTGAVGNGIIGLGGGVAGLGGAGVYPGGVTTLGAGSTFGSAVGGYQTFANGGTVQTIQGAPIYVPQPYPAYYSAGSYGGGYNYGGYASSAGGALPFGLELGAGQDFVVDGNIFPGEAGKTDAVSLLTVSDLAPIAYDEGFDNAKGVDLTATYDLNYNTTILGRVGYSKADGNLINVGTVSDGVVTEDLYAEFSDLEQYTIEGGFRHYMGAPTGMRPYIGATAGFVKTKDVDLTQSSATLVDPTVFTQNYVDGGWSPTAAGLIGAEWAVGPKAGIGVETGIRWTEALDSNFVADDKISVPVRLRGRLSF